jgi:hypothetical protein
MRGALLLPFLFRLEVAFHLDGDHSIGEKKIRFGCESGVFILTKLPQLHQ